MSRTPNPVMTEQREVEIEGVRYTRRVWADGSVQHYRANRRQACLVKMDRSRNAKACARIDAAFAPTTAERWKALTDKADAPGVAWAVRSAYMAAEGNARDTFVENGRRDDLLDPRCADELAELAFGSLCFTGDFTDIESVRDFYEAAGYRW